MAYTEQELAAEIFSRLVANYPNIHQKISPDGKPNQELDHVLNMIFFAAQASASRFFSMTEDRAK